MNLYYKDWFFKYQRRFFLKIAFTLPIGLSYVKMIPWFTMNEEKSFFERILYIGNLCKSRMIMLEKMVFDYDERTLREESFL